MEEKIGTMINDWLAEKSSRPDASIQDFTLKKYLEIHQSDLEDNLIKEEAFKKRIAAQKENREKFERFKKNHFNVSVLERWQAIEMLDNVMNELDMDWAERFRYLASVKLMVYDRIVKLFSRSEGEESTKCLEERYEQEWKKAEEGVTEKELEKIFEEAIFAMQYAGISYDDETREVLAGIGVGKREKFQGSIRGEAGQDICFLTDFFLSEMVLSDTDITEQEKNIIVEQVVPVSVSSIAMIQKGEDENSVMKVSLSYLGRIFSEKHFKLFSKITVLFLAAKAVLALFHIIVAGGVVGIGIYSLWNYCKSKLNLNNTEGKELLGYLIKKSDNNILKEKEKEEKEGEWIPKENKELRKETEFENA